MQSRVVKSVRNTIFGMIGLLCSLIISFVSRSIFIRILGVEYNGVNGLFSNILSVLNLAELGFATSIAYALYKPLQDGDEKTAAMLMDYFAKIYRIIALIVAVVGCCCIPILQYLISEDISELSFSLNELRIYFAMFLANTVCSYLLAYRRTIITADQNSYLVSNVDNICNIVLNVLQIILLYITRNFYAYLIIMIAKTVINNLILHLIASKRYPYLSQYKKDKLPKEERSAIFKNVQAVFLHRIGSVIIFSTTSIIISAFVSLIDAGKYSNYLMIVNNISNFINIIFNSVTASIGNLCLNDDKEHQYEVFKRISYVSNFFTIFTFVCYVCLLNDFINIWLGEDMQFDIFIVIAISLNAMVSYILKTVLAFKVIAIPVENFVLFKYGLKRNSWHHVMSLLLTTVFAFSLAALTYFICSFIPDGIGWFILEFFFVVLFAAGVYILLTCRTKEFKYYLNLAKSIVGKIIKKERAIR